MSVVLPSRHVTDRLADLVEQRLLPALEERGFHERNGDGFAVAERDGVAWLVDLALAPWSDDRRLCFSLVWGVHVPGIEAVLGGDEPEVVRPSGCPVHGHLGVLGADAFTWFELRARMGPLAGLADTNLAGRVLRAVDDDVLPALAALATPADVQEHLHTGLVTGRGVPKGDELQRIRWIAALSLLLGQRENAVRWLDYLEARSATTIAPDVVAERLAPLRRRCLAS